MKRKQSTGVIYFLIITTLLGSCVWSYTISALGSQQSSVAFSAPVDPNLQYEPTKELWALVSSLRQLRTDYYEKQRQNTEKIQQIRDIAQKLQAEVEELRRREKQIDKSFSEIQSDIRKSEFENEENKLTESSTAKKLERFIAKQTEEIEKGIPYRKDDRLTRLKGSASNEQPLEDQSVTDVFGRVWSFSQEELRIARSGESFTDLVELGEDRLQYARLFRVGHQILGYLTEQGDQAGIWLDGVGWEEAKKGRAESVKEAVGILDRRRVPNYVLLPVKIETVDIKTKGRSKD
jgi:hypothetical protein